MCQFCFCSIERSINKKYLCNNNFEMHFLREKFLNKQLEWLLIKTADTHYAFFAKLFTTSKNVYEFEMDKYKSMIIVNWLQSS